MAKAPALTDDERQGFDEDHPATPITAVAFGDWPEQRPIGSSRARFGDGWLP
jgi:hypothetical protein